MWILPLSNTLCQVEAWGSFALMITGLYSPAMSTRDPKLQTVVTHSHLLVCVWMFCSYSSNHGILKWNNKAGKMAQVVKTVWLSSTPGTNKKEKVNRFYRLSSELHIHPIAHIHTVLWHTNTHINKSKNYEIIGANYCPLTCLNVYIFLHVYVNMSVQVCMYILIRAGRGQRLTLGLPQSFLHLNGLLQSPLTEYGAHQVSQYPQESSFPPPQHWGCKSLHPLCFVKCRRV